MDMGWNSIFSFLIFLKGQYLRIFDAFGLLILGRTYYFAFANVIRRNMLKNLQLLNTPETTNSTVGQRCEGGGGGVDDTGTSSFGSVCLLFEKPEFALTLFGHLIVGRPGLDGP